MSFCGCVKSRMLFPYHYVAGSMRSRYLLARRARGCHQWSHCTFDKGLLCILWCQLQPIRGFEWLRAASRNVAVSKENFVLKIK